MPTLKVELVRAGPGAIGRHEETLAIEEEGFPPKTANKVRDVVERQPLIRFLVYVPGLALAALAIITLLTANDPWAYVTWQRWVLIALAAAVPLFIGMQIYWRLRSDSPIVL